MWSDLVSCEGRKCWDAANFLSDRSRTVSHQVKQVSFYPVFPAAVFLLPLLDAHQLVAVPGNRRLISEAKTGIRAINLWCVIASNGAVTDKHSDQRAPTGYFLVLLSVRYKESVPP